MSFNPYPSKQAQEVIFFFREIYKRGSSSHIFQWYTSHPDYRSKTYWAVPWCKTQLRKLSNKLPRQGLITIYKPFLRPHLDYSDIVYDKPNNETFINESEKGQHDAALTITGAIRGISGKALCWTWPWISHI